MRADRQGIDRHGHDGGMVVSSLPEFGQQTHQVFSATRRPVLLDLPFHGRWVTRNSPARRVPSHGTALFGTAYAIDFVPLGADGRSAPMTWRTLLGPEPPEVFAGFGREILSPASGVVAAVLDGQPDHSARRTLAPQVPYALAQARRIRAGLGAIAGNHVAVALDPGGPYVLLAHLQGGSVSVEVGQRVTAGQIIGRCGNSGNSTEPHLHLQVVDTSNWASARGLPIAFTGADGVPWLPGEGEEVLR